MDDPDGIMRLDYELFTPAVPALIKNAAAADEA
jgi:hypothetical protein